jgi:hypothetical protein
VTERLRCAEMSRAIASDPVGSAAAADVFVLVESPLPWPPDIAHDPLLAAISDAARRATSAVVRVQAVIGDRAIRDERRVIVWRTQGPWFTAYTRREATGRPDDLPAVAAALVDGTSPRGDDHTPDVLVCTHGARDRCCGADGSRLFQRALAMGGARVWRTSHTGGHRFAPTMLSFPDGLCWGRLDADALAAIRSHSASPRALATHYRGCVAVASSAMQAAERASFVTVGWEWLTWSRRVERATDDEVVVVSFRTPAGERGDIRMLVREARRIPIPVCGQPLAAARKDEPEWLVAEAELFR